VRAVAAYAAHRFAASPGPMVLAWGGTPLPRGEPPNPHGPELPGVLTRSGAEIAGLLLSPARLSL